ncbi:MAG: flagellar biosynthetic protein FliO [Nitrospiraceae bacterium]
MDLYDSAVRTVAALAIVLGLMGMATWLFRRFGSPAWLAGGQAPAIRVLATTAIAPRTSISLVSVGGEVLIVGTGASGIVSLGRVTDPAAVLQATKGTQSLMPTTVEAPRESGPAQHGILRLEGLLK